jgi:FAD/FMN-containing dehydrogenase
VPQGGNTGLCGGATPDNTGDSVIILLHRLNQIFDVDIQNSTITVGAGAILKQVQDAALEHGTLFPLSLAAEGSCTIGGNLATNAGGVQVLRYGNMRDLTLGLEVVTASGEIWNGLRSLRKDNTGYSLKDLFIGSEGTLGIITAATLKVFPLPTTKITALVKVDDVESSIALLQQAQKACGADLTAFELISSRAMELVSDRFVLAQQLLADRANWIVLMEFSSIDREDTIRLQIQNLLMSAIDSSLVIDGIVAESIQQSKSMWEIRETIPEAQLQLGNLIKHDISLPISELAGFIDSTNLKLREKWPDTEVIIFGHVGDGNLHYNVFPVPGRTRQDHEGQRDAIKTCMHNLVHAMGGSVSAEHGIGRLKVADLERYGDPAKLVAMRAIKAALDPKGILNPGAVLRQR